VRIRTGDECCNTWTPHVASQQVGLLVARMQLHYHQLLRRHVLGSIGVIGSAWQALHCALLVVREHLRQVWTVAAVATSHKRVKFFLTLSSDIFLPTWLER
jgi:hypothetical protein